MVAWDWSAFFDALTNPYLYGGAWVTLWLTAVSITIGLILGLAAALARMSPRKWLRYPASFYIWAWRGTPLLVQLIMIYTGLPQFGIRLDVIQASIVGLALNEGAYLAEIVRSGILSVPKGQFEAARAFGMRYGTMMRVIVFPQALRIIVPPLGNSINGLLKTTSLVSVISMEELLRRGQSILQANFRVLETLLAVAIMYVVMTSAWSAVQSRIEARLGRSSRGNAARPKLATGENA
jgi:polar amino acid transport system permease protein